MRSLVFIVALAISPGASTMCQLTCSAQSAGHQHAAEVPSCHESSQESDGPALKADFVCRHSADDVLLADGSQPFQLSAVTVELSSLVAPIARPIYSRDATPISSASPPPPLLPLRI